MAVFPLKNMPSDVKKYILKLQGAIKEKKGISQYSQEMVIYQIIREHKKMLEAKER